MVTATPPRRLAAVLVILAVAAGGCRGGGTDPSGTGGGPDEQGFARVYVQAPRHPAGAYVRVSGVAVERDHVRLQVGLSHAHTHPRSTVEFNDVGVTLADAAGATYPLAPPPDNPTLEVAAGMLLSGTLVFRVAQGTPRGPFTVTFNDGSDGRQPGGDERGTSRPLITVADIPG